MSEKVETAAETPAAPLANGADTSVPETAAPAEADDDFLDDPKSEAKPEGEAKAEKADAKPQGEDDDFLKAETDKDDAKDKADAQGDAKPAGESEAYQPFTLPEGLVLDETVLAEATPLLRKIGADQDGAQELVSFYAAKTQEAIASYHEELAAKHVETLKSWETELKAMPEYKGAALSEAKARVATVLNQLGSPELRQLLTKDYGVVRNPHVFKFLDAIGSKLSEDSLVRDDAGAPVKATPKRTADEMYS